uniref:FTH domain-containing protein n=1 Tax=Rhabditophanes sp. KR3021 TaxID=114890 RepID=A0AC35U3V0_9BILA
MNISIKSPLTLAMAQPHIIQVSTANISNMVSFADTNATFYNAVNNLKVNIVSKAFPSDKLIYIWCEPKMFRGNLFGFHFNSAKTFEKIVNSFEEEYFDAVKYLQIEMDISCDSFDVKIIEIFANLCLLFKNMSNKLHFLQKVSFKVSFRPATVSKEPIIYGNELFNIFLLFTSKTVTSLIFKSDITVLDNFVTEQFRHYESTLLVNFPNLKEFIWKLILKLHLMQNGLTTQDNEKLKEFFGKTKLTNVLRLYVSVDNIKLLGDVNQIIKYQTESMNGNDFNIRCTLKHFEKFDLPSENAIQINWNTFIFKTRFDHFYNFLALNPACNLFTNIRDLAITLTAAIDESTIIQARQNLHNLSSIKSLYVYSFSEIGENRQFRPYRDFILSMPQTIINLTFYNTRFCFSEINHQLAESFPNLKRLEIFDHSENYLDNFDYEYFMVFKNLQLLKLQCLMRKTFKYPINLRVFVTECKDEFVTKPIPSSSNSDYTIENNIKRFKTAQTPHIGRNSIDTSCSCYDSKLEFSNLIVHQENFGLLRCINLKHVKDWKLYEKSLIVY